MASALTMTTEVLHLRVLKLCRGRRGHLVSIGAESRSLCELVEAGHLFQEIVHGTHYKFTLSPSGQRLLDQADGITGGQS